MAPTDDGKRRAGEAMWPDAAARRATATVRVPARPRHARDGTFCGCTRCCNNSPSPQKRPGRSHVYHRRKT